MLIAAALNPPVNLLQSAGDQDQDWRRWRLVGGLAAAVLILPVIGAAALAARDDLAARDLRQRSEAAIAAAFTDIPATADPVAEARRRIAMALPAGGAAPAAAALFAAVETVPGAELDSLSADSVGGVRATVSYAAFQDLETLKAGVEATGLTLTDTSTLEDNGRVVSDVMVGAGLPESGS